MLSATWSADNGDGTYSNPILYADYSDPDIVRVGDDFYMTSSSFVSSPGLPVLHSDDLVNWELIGHAAASVDGGDSFNLIGGTAYEQGFWAPSIRHHEGTFYIAVQPTFGPGRIYYTDNPAGEWSYHELDRSIYDPALFFDTDGTGYIVSGHGPQDVMTLNSSYSAIVSEASGLIDSGGEGSHLVKRGSYYYLFNANPSVWPFQLRVSRATNLLGPWETGHVALTATTGGHQGAIVDLPDNTPETLLDNQWYGYVHQDSGGIGRVPRLGPVFWENDWPVFGTPAERDVIADTYAKPILGGQVLTQPGTDDFSATDLQLQWQWNHNPDNSRWSLTERPGYMRLRPTQAEGSWTARNTLTQKTQGPQSHSVVKLDLSGMQPGDVAGAGVLGKVNAHLAVTVDALGNKTLGMNMIKDKVGSYVGAEGIPIVSDTLYLRTDVDFEKALGVNSYSYDGVNWTKLGGNFELLFGFGSTFQGQQFAIFSYNPTTANSAGYVDIDSFVLEGGANLVTTQRERPTLNAERTTFVGDNGQLLRGPYTSTEWTPAVPKGEVEAMKQLGFNAVHLYAEVFDPNYVSGVPGSGTAPGYAATEIDKMVEYTRDLGLYLVMTIGNGGNNGDHNYDYAIDFWDLYADRYKDETHVIYEIHNEPLTWGPPYLTQTTPANTMAMEVDAYNTIRSHAPDTPVLLFSYAVLGGTGGAEAAMTDIEAFNTAVFGNANHQWTNEAVGFHGYAGYENTPTALEGILGEGYPVFMTEFAGIEWGENAGGLDVETTAALERLGVSWTAFHYVPPTGVSDNVTLPEVYRNRVEHAGLSWTPDFGTWPVARGTYGNADEPWSTTSTFVNEMLTGTLRIEAENFDTGGQGVAYSDSGNANDGGQYRLTEGVDVTSSSDVGGGHVVGWTADGEWLEYTIFVEEPGFYDLDIRYATPFADGAVQVFANEDNITGSWQLAATGGYSNWQTDSMQVFLEWGQQKLRLEVENGGFDFNWLEVTPSSDAPIADGVYKLVNRNSGLAMEYDTSTNKVVQGEYTDALLEQWQLQHLGAGQYKVTSAHNNDAWNVNPLPGQDVGITWWWDIASKWQRFLVRPTEDGFFRIAATSFGFDFEVEAGSFDPGSKLVQNEFSGEAEEQWAILQPASSAFPAQLTAVRSEQATVPGDYNQDGRVDAMDYAVWRESLGTNTSVGEQADGNGDGTVEEGDLNLWRSQYGSSSSTHRITLSWTPVPGATGYSIKRGSEEGGPYTTIADGVIGTQYSDPFPLEDGGYYVVSALGAWGESLQSAEASPLKIRAHLKLDEATGATAADATGNGWTGTLENGAGWSTGHSGSAVDLDGTNDYVSLPTGVLEGLSQATLSGWYYLDDAVAWTRLFDFGTDTSNYMFLTPVAGDSGNVRFAITTGSGEQRIDGSAPIPSGEWVHVAVTMDGGRGVLYVNGEVVGTNNFMALTPDSLGTTTQNYIGRSIWPDPYLNGLVDDFRIYEEALSASDVAALYEGPASSVPLPPISLNAIATSYTQIDLTWAGSAEADSYNVHRSNVNGGPYTNIASGVTGNAFSDTTALPNHAYYYVVSAVNANGESANSTEAVNAPYGIGENSIFRDVFTADPAALVVGDTVYVYTGHDISADGEGFVMPEWLAYSSQDLKSWTAHGPIMEPSDFAWSDGSDTAWASQMIEKDGMFYFYTTVFHSEGGMAIGVASSTSPTGPFTDARGSALITEAMTPIGDAWGDIDPTVFIDDDGTPWLSWGHGTFYIVKLNTNMTELDGEIQLFDPPHSTEGPWLHKREDTYYLSYASIDDEYGGGERIAYATGPSVTGPWTYQGLITAEADNSYTIHQSIIEFDNQWYFFYHDASLTINGVPGKFERRAVSLAYLDYNPDGTIRPVSQTAAGISVPRTSPTDVLAEEIAGDVQLGWNTVPGATHYVVKRSAVSSGPYSVIGNTVKPDYLDIGAAGSGYFYVVSAFVDGVESTDSTEALQLPPVPYASLPFSEGTGTTTADTSGNGWDGTLVNGASWDAGVFGTAVSLDGTDDYVSLPSGVINGQDAITISAWVNLDSTMTWARIVDFGTGINNYLYLAASDSSSGIPRFAINSGSGEQVIIGREPIPLGIWTHLAVTLKDGTGILYVDGVEVNRNSQMTLSVADLGATTLNYIGKSQYPDPYLDGRVDDLRIADVAAGPGEIAAMAESIVPAAPTNLTAVGAINDAINLNWTATPRTTGYTVKRANTSGGPYTTIASGLTDTSYNDPGLTGGTTYYYVVSASNPAGESPDSLEANAATGAVPEAWLQFDETSGTTAADSTANGWTGSLVNGALWSSGQSGNAVELDGINDYVSLPNGVVDGLTDITVAAWVNLDTISNWSRVFDFGTGTAVNMFLTSRAGDSGNVCFAITTSGAGGEQRINGSAPLPTGAWTHVAVAISGNIGVLYVDGFEVGRNSSMSLSPASLGVTNQNYIGRSQYFDPYLDGRVDDFRIYSTALSSAEIALLSNNSFFNVINALPSPLTPLELATGPERESSTTPVVLEEGGANAFAVHQPMYFSRNRSSAPLLDTFRHAYLLRAQAAKDEAIESLLIVSSLTDNSNGRRSVPVLPDEEYAVDNETQDSSEADELTIDLAVEALWR